MNHKRTNTDWVNHFYVCDDEKNRVTDKTLYLDQYRASQEVNFLSRILSEQQKPVRKVLNLACGVSALHTHLISSVLKPSEIKNLDISNSFIKQASTEWIAKYKKKSPSQATFQQADMRNLNSIRSSYDLITLFGNSFGYYDHETNISILKNIRKKLTKGGVLIITLPDFDIASSYTKKAPQKWSNSSLINGESIIAQSTRYFLKRIQVSVCKTHYINKDNDLEIRIIRRYLSIYPIENQSGYFSFSQMANIADLQLLANQKLPVFHKAFGLMKNLIMIALTTNKCSS